MKTKLVTRRHPAFLNFAKRSQKNCARRNRIPAQSKDVIVVNGGMQGLFGAFQSIVNPGDEVLLFSPYWTPIKDLVAHCQGQKCAGPHRRSS